MKIILTREEMVTILIKGIQETNWGKNTTNFTKISFINDGDNADVENIYPITRIEITPDYKNE